MPPMRAMVMERAGSPLVMRTTGQRELGRWEVRIAVEACGVCRTDLHVVDGELTRPRLPLVPGHQIVGRVVEAGGEAVIAKGRRVGVPWLAGTCSECRYCRSERENLCDDALFTGYDVDGGFAEEAVADSRYCFELSEDAEAAGLAPLLCGGLIGFRALRVAGDAKRIGFYGFGSAAHILAQICLAQGREVFAFTRAGDDESQQFARSLGVSWAGAIDQSAPGELDAAIIFAPAGDLVPLALAGTAKGGRVVCAGIHMSDIPSFRYELLWGERSLHSVANLTRRDGVEFFSAIAGMPLHTATTEYSLSDANKALDDLRAGGINGSAVLVP